MSEELSSPANIQMWLDRLKSGDNSARDYLVALIYERFRYLASKSFQKFPRVQRWEQTDDILQNVAIRMFSALDAVKPQTVDHFDKLAALQIRRELLDLKDHYYGPEGSGAQHETWFGLNGNADHGDMFSSRYNDPADPTNDPTKLDSWTVFHQRIDSLPKEERDVFELNFYNGRTPAEISEILNISPRQVYRLITKARLQLANDPDGSPLE